jgi:NTE family protein
VGAVIGAMYCSGVSVREMIEVAGLVRFRDFARWTVSRFGFCSNDRMAPFLAKLIKCTKFEDLKTPLIVTATDFVTGEPVLFRSGPLVDAIRASCAYPGMFLPVNVNGRLLIDGLLAYPVPSEPLKQAGADRVISVHLAAHWVNNKGPRHIFDVIGQCFSIAQSKMCGAWQAASDIVLTPNVSGFGYDQFERAPELIAFGEKVAREAVPQMKAWLELPQPLTNPLGKLPKLAPQPAAMGVSEVKA